MSGKKTILHTSDNEHWYKDSFEPIRDDKHIITIEFSKKNIRIDLNDEEDLVISITNPDCEIYDIINKLNQNQ
jgi:hypothetical protein